MLQFNALTDSVEGGGGGGCLPQDHGVWTEESEGNREPNTFPSYPTDILTKFLNTFFLSLLSNASFYSSYWMP